jgi:hypothetical protein
MSAYPAGMGLHSSCTTRSPFGGGALIPAVWSFTPRARRDPPSGGERLSQRYGASFLVHGAIPFRGGSAYPEGMERWSSCTTRSPFGGERISRRYRASLLVHGAIPSGGGAHIPKVWSAGPRARHHRGLGGSAYPGGMERGPPAGTPCFGGCTRVTCRIGIRRAEVPRLPGGWGREPKPLTEPIAPDLCSDCRAWSVR